MIRNRSPALRTLPSSTDRHAEQRADGADVLAPALEREDRGAGGDLQPLDLASALISSSVIPSLTYSLSGSGLALTNGQHGDGLAGRRAAAGRAGRTAGSTSASQNSATLAKRSAGSLASARSSARSTGRGDLRPARAERAGRFGGVARHRGRGAAAGEGRLAGQHLVQHAGQAVLIAPRVEHRLAAGLLRAHVRRRADRHTRLGDRGAGASLLAQTRGATPKSATTGSPSCSRMFSGLMSRWTMPCRWA